jgi:hypothetical protein
MDTCTWIENVDGIWETECHMAFEFIDGRPSENNYAYCPFCGKQLVESRLEVSEDVDMA